MRIFMTGATGYIGSAVASAFRERGHDVGALARPDSETRALRDAGAVIVSGELSDLPSLTDTLHGYEAFVHIAQSHSEAAVALDRTAVDTFLARDGFTLYTSGCWLIGNTGEQIADEATPPNPLPLVAWRAAHEEAVLASGKHAVIRPGCVYGGKQSLLADWFAAVDQDQPIRIVGDGQNRWTMVHVDELADLYVRIVEQRAAGIFHGIDDTRDTLTLCAATLTDRVEYVDPETVRPKLGPFTDALLVDQMVSSERTREAVGWTPRRTFTNSVDAQWAEWRKATK
jgi:nucleoside-diphosphate-sugar epimerase